MLYLTHEIEEQFKSIVEEVDWLSDSTKETARNKLDAMIHNIGYPDLVLNDTELSQEIKHVNKLQLQIRLISDFQFNYDESQFFENVLKNLNGRTKKEMSMLGQVSSILMTC